MLKYVHLNLLKNPFCTLEKYQFKYVRSVKQLGIYSINILLCIFLVITAILFHGGLK